MLLLAILSSSESLLALLWLIIPNDIEEATTSPKIALSSSL